MKFLLTVALGLGIGLAPALAAGEQSFTPPAFETAQKAGKVILIDVTASWCPTCKVQKSILDKLMTEPAYRDIVILSVDFDTQKDVLRRFGVRSQSTLIAFRGTAEHGRSVGDTNPASIRALLDMARG
jgi:thiol-disulfide isomerase/thioredoxin